MTDTEVTVETALDCRNVLGESPLWHPDERRLYWIDIRTGELFRYDPCDGGYTTSYDGDNVRGLTIQADGSLLLFMEDGTIRSLDRGVMTTVFDGIPGVRDVSYNDVIADPEGRVFCDVRPTAERLGRLYRLDPDGTFAEVVNGVAGPNGLGFSPDATTLYFTDSWAHEIAAFTYDRRSGALSDRAVFASLRNDSGFPIPDGLTVDADGGVWSARFGDDVVRYAPDGRVTRRVSLPTTTVTSLGFGGPDYGSLYATTGSDNFGTLEDIGEHAGALFRITVSGIRGRPEFRSRIRI